MTAHDVLVRVEQSLDQFSIARRVLSFGRAVAVADLHSTGLVSDIHLDLPSEIGDHDQREDAFFSTLMPMLRADADASR